MLWIQRKWLLRRLLVPEAAFQIITAAIASGREPRETGGGNRPQS
jgi:hypothetical protein